MGFQTPRAEAVGTQVTRALREKALAPSWHGLLLLVTPRAQSFLICNH